MLESTSPIVPHRSSIGNLLADVVLFEGFLSLAQPEAGKPYGKADWIQDLKKIEHHGEGQGLRTSTDPLCGYHRRSGFDE